MECVKRAYSGDQKWLTEWLMREPSGSESNQVPKAFPILTAFLWKGPNFPDQRRSQLLERWSLASKFGSKRWFTARKRANDAISLCVGPSFTAKKRANDANSLCVGPSFTAKKRVSVAMPAHAALCRSLIFRLGCDKCASLVCSWTYNKDKAKVSRFKDTSVLLA